MATSLKEKPPSRLQIWKVASRPHTLTASIAPVIAGYALTLHYYKTTDSVDGTILGQMALQFALFAGLIQIGTNLHNDYADFVKGEFHLHGIDSNSQIRMMIYNKQLTIYRSRHRQTSRPSTSNTKGVADTL